MYIYVLTTSSYHDIVNFIMVNKDPKPVDFSAEQAAMAAEMLKALAHPLRVQIASALSSGAMHVTELAEHLGIVPAVVSQQLRILRSASLVAPRTENGHAYYRIVEPHLFDMLECMERCLASRRERGEL